MKKTVSIIIPSWNAKDLLQKNLPSVIAAKPDEIIVVDDGSVDGSKEFIAHSFPQIRLFVHSNNMGFIPSINDGVNSSKSEIVILLNNDVAPAKNFLNPLIAHFDDSSVFGVCSAVAGYGYSKASYSAGFISLSQGKPGNKTSQALWASGGSAAYSRSKWNTLGGFDKLFQPFYFEDLDISYRAWKRGWKVLWEPKSQVNHTISSTIGKKFSSDYIDRITQRNHLLFIWKNITSPDLFSDHLGALSKKLLSGRMVFPFISALTKSPQVFSKRIVEKEESIVSDEEIFEKFK